MMDFIKASILFPLYFIGGPMLGVWLAGRREAQRGVFCLMVFMTAWFPTKITLMLGSIELYRGHTKGFEFSLIEVLAIALLVAAAQTRQQQRPTPPLIPGGTWLYLFWCALMTISIFAAYNQLYVWMGVHKFTKIVLLFIAGFHFLRDETDLTWLARTMSGMVILMALVCLKMRLLDGGFRTTGWFEHQNPMAMWAYFAALPSFALGLRRETPPRDALLYLGGAGAAGLCALLSVSRGALAAFALGCALVMALALLRGASPRLIGVSVAAALAAVVVASTMMKSVFDRMAQEKERASSEVDLRVVMIDQAKAMLHDSSIGIGWNNYGIANSRPLGRYSEILEEWDASRGFAVIEDFYYANPLTESYYWLLLGENGYPGFYGCLLFFAATLYWAARSALANWRDPRGWFAGGVFVVLSLHYLHSSVERVLSQTKNLSLLLLIVGVVARMDWDRRQRRAARGMRKSEGGRTNR